MPGCLAALLHQGDLDLKPAKKCIKCLEKKQWTITADIIYHMHTTHMLICLAKYHHHHHHRQPWAQRPLVSDAIVTIAAHRCLSRAAWLNSCRVAPHHCSMSSDHSRWGRFNITTEQLWFEINCNYGMSTNKHSGVLLLLWNTLSKA